MRLDHWLTAPIPPVPATMRLISAFLREEPIVWDQFSLTDVQTVIDELRYYTPFEWAYDEWDEDAGDPPPNQDNTWHSVLHVLEMTHILKTLPGVCPPDIPFY